MRYPIGIQNFRDIREGGYVYVDKTEQVYKLAHGDGQRYFLNRPYKFGKSLLVSTLEEYFLGHKELFDGLAIANLEKEWIEYPRQNCTSILIRKLPGLRSKIQKRKKKPMSICN